MNQGGYSLECRDLTYRYDTGFTLRVDNLELRSGESMGLSGHNGSGKTTLMRLLARLYLPEKGSIKMNGKEAPPLEDLAGAVTMLFQETYLLKRSVYDNVALGLRARQETGIDSKVRQALESVGLDPDDFSRRSWKELSGGEARRVALASRLVLRPRLLLLDEPLSGVDEESIRIITGTIERLRGETGMTLIISAHDREWLERSCDTIVRMQSGKTVP